MRNLILLLSSIVIVGTVLAFVGIGRYDKLSEQTFLKAISSSFSSLAKVSRLSWAALYDGCGPDEAECELSVEDAISLGGTVPPYFTGPSELIHQCIRSKETENTPTNTQTQNDCSVFEVVGSSELDRAIQG